MKSRNTLPAAQLLKMHFVLFCGGNNMSMSDDNNKLFKFKTDIHVDLFLQK